MPIFARPIPTWPLRPWGALALALLMTATMSATDSIDYCVQLSVVAQASPPSLTLSWVPDAGATTYTIHRRPPSQVGWGSPLATLGGSPTSYTDTAVTVGTVYEYRVTKGNAVGGVGFALSAIDAPLVDDRGTVVLLVDDSFSAALSTELDRLAADLVGDGWSILRHDVSRGASVPAIKAVIAADYAAAPTRVRMVMLVGHVPVPYSGDIAPDGHGDHVGAWPADGYYGDMDGAYTDASVNDSSAADPRNRNVPGDGKFDQGLLTGTVILPVGRVDFWNMWTFASELDLLRQYLDRDHAFRTRQWTAQAKAVVIDGFGDYAPDAQTGLRSFAPLVGAGNITVGGDAIWPFPAAPADWWPTMSDASLAGSPYLFAYQGGPGWTNGIINGKVMSYDFANRSSHAVFTAFFGSYFGDWGYDVALLRAPLAGAGEGLTCCWGGRPDWYFHRMGLGETIGSTVSLLELHGADYMGYAYPGTHIGLMGDPTLRMHPMQPPGSVAASASAGVAHLSWAGSADAGLGYHVYRASSLAGPFTRLTAAPVGAAYDDAVPVGGTFVYGVRAVRREISPSGSYINASIGIASPFVTIPAGSGTGGTSGTGTSSTSGTGTSGTSGTGTSGSGTSGTGTGSTSSASGTATSGSGTTSGTGSVGTAGGDTGGSAKKECGRGSGLSLALALLAVAVRFALGTAKRPRD